MNQSHKSNFKVDLRIKITVQWNKHIHPGRVKTQERRCFLTLYDCYTNEYIVSLLVVIRPLVPYK